MTVRELIEKLRKLPQDLEVLDMGMPVEDVRVVDGYPDRDPGNPDCKYVSVVVIA